MINLTIDIQLSKEHAHKHMPRALATCMAGRVKKCSAERRGLPLVLPSVESSATTNPSLISHLVKFLVSIVLCADLIVNYLDNRLLPSLIRVRGCGY